MWDPKGSLFLYQGEGAAGVKRNILVDSKVDFGKSRNLILTSVIFITGLSGVTLQLGNVELKGMVLACIVGMVLGLLFYLFDRFHLLNDMDDTQETDAVEKK